MNRKIFCYSLLSLALMGCSAINKKQAVGDFEYANRAEESALTIPEGLTKPKENNEYFVSDKVNQEGPIGINVDIRAPTLVLPIATSTRIEQENDAAKVWFDQVLDDKDLYNFIVNAINIEMAERNASTSLKDGSDKDLLTSLIINDTESSSWLSDDDAVSESARYAYSFETKPHGRSVAITVDLIEYSRSDVKGESNHIDAIDKQRLEMTMLNEIISQVDYQYRLANRENRLLRSNQKLVSLGQNDKNEAAFIVEMAIDQLWSNMPVFFSNYGFTVSDLNDSKKTYYVDYTQPDSSFWDSIWGDEQPVVDLPNGNYQFVLTESGDSTLVNIINEAGEVLSANDLERIFPVIEPALSFRDVL